MSDPVVPGIPEPQPTLVGLVQTTKALKAGVEALAGLRGGTTQAASSAAAAAGVARKFTATLGDGNTSSFTVQHGLNVAGVLVQAYSTASPYGLLPLNSVERSNSNATTVVFAAAPAAKGALVVVIG